MKLSLRARALPLAIAALLAASGALAQNTSSSLSGHVLDASGKPVAGATVQIVHVPSQTTRVVTTDINGGYSAQGLRVGGPYDITVLQNGQKEAEKDDVTLRLAENSTIDLTLAAPATAQQPTNLAAVTVTGTALLQTFNPDNKGITTNVSQRELRVLPNPDRSIQSIARLDPFIILTNNNQAGGFTQINALGQNNRYNNITIDAVPTNDSFGLEANGLPSLNQPISYDAIEEYNISTANYDVTSKRAVGANINIVTKSGTNDFHGSAYYAWTNAKDLTGNDYKGNEFEGYTQKWTGGVTLGGPIVKDKLFFFVNAEESKLDAPGANFGPIGSNAANIVPVSQDDLNRIIAIAKGYGMTPGDLSASSANQDEKKYLAKIDWNISEGHRLSVRASEVKSDQPIIQGNFTGSSPQLGLSSFWYDQHRNLKQYVANLYDDWSDTFSTEASLSYAKYRSTPSVLAQQPQVLVYAGDAGGAVQLGEDQFRDYNVLNVDTLNGFFAGTWFLGDHTMKAGFDYQRDKFYNLFGRTEFGNYTFDSVDDFAAGQYSFYNLYQPAPGYTLNDIAARWTLNQWGLFWQDTWQISPRFSLQYGLRMDIPGANGTPVLNTCFASAPNPAGNGPAGCEYGGFGMANNATINHTILEPRLSFNYAFDTQYKTQLRGGIGISEGMTPGVWLSNPYTNNGVTLTSATSFSGTFNPDPYTQQLPAGAPPAPEVDLLDPHFKLPTVLKASLGFDRELPWWGLVFSADYEHLQNQNAILYQNLNLGTPSGTLPDGRLSYWGSTDPSLWTLKSGVPRSASSNVDPSRNPNFYDVVYLTNSNKGKADYLSLVLTKPFNDAFSGNFGVVLGHATDVNPGTSSQAASNLNKTAVTNPSEDVESNSSYEVRKRVLASLTWQHRFFGDYTTSVSAIYDGHTGQPYSWVFGNDVSGVCYGSNTNCQYGLVYIPHPGDVEFDSSTSTAAQQQFFNYIAHDDYLSGHQGQIAGRNAVRSPWVNRIDLSFRQQIPGLFKGNTGEVRLDIYNVLNLLNNKWGDVYDVDFPNVRTLANFAGVDPATGKYVYSLPTDSNGNYKPGSLTYENSHAQSVWSMLVTVRYTF